MGHVASNPRKLLGRVRRMGGQIAALETLLQGQPECADVLVQIAAIRGAAHGLMMEVLADHLRSHVAEERNPERRQSEAAAVAVLMRTCLK